MGMVEDAASSTSSSLLPLGQSELLRSLLGQIGFVECSANSSPNPDVQAATAATTSPLSAIAITRSPEPYLRVHYFRVAGTTSVHPGVNRISLKLRLKAPTTAVAPLAADAASTSLAASASSASDYPTMSSSAPFDSSPQATAAAATAPISFDPSTNLPPASIYEPLLTIFFDVCAQHFPSIQRRRIYRRIETGTMSAFLLCAMCAMAARFAPEALQQQQPGAEVEAGNAFMEKCAELLVQTIRFPTTDAVTALQLMAWCEYGLGSESAFWLYAGLAFRMAEDGGFAKASAAYSTLEDEDHVVRTRLLFWSLFVTDRLLSFATGRTCAIREEIVDLPLPTDDDLIPRPSSPSVEKVARPSAWVACVRLMVICGRIL